MAEIEAGDVVMARGSTGTFHAVVRGVRLSRLVVERCDGRPSGPVSLRDVVTIYKPAGEPTAAADSAGRRLRPTSQMRLDID